MNSIPFSYSQETIDALLSSLSPERLSLYIKSAQGDEEQALRLYLWNLQLCESLYGPLQTLEVTMRNSMNRELIVKYGPDWFDPLKPPSFQDTQYERIDKAKESFDKSRTIANSDIVSNIAFGFWTDILHHRVYDELWNTCLHKAFPHRAKGTRRSTIGPVVNELKTLRNRIAHHEPILRRPLEREYQQIIEITSWCCPKTAHWSKEHSRFNKVWRSKPSP